MVFVEGRFYERSEVKIGLKRSLEVIIVVGLERKGESCHQRKWELSEAENDGGRG